MLETLKFQTEALKEQQLADQLWSFYQASNYGDDFSQ